MLCLEKQEDSEKVPDSRQSTPSVDTGYPLSQVLAVIGAGKSLYTEFYHSPSHTTNSLPGPLHLSRGGVHWQRGLSETPSYPTMARKPLVIQTNVEPIILSK